MHFEESLITLGVRPNDLDSLGHVNNAVALEYLEAGRWAWMDQHGISRDGSGPVPVVLRVEVDYRREIRPQNLTVSTVLDVVAGDDFDDEVTYRVHFKQRVLIDGGSQLAVEARVQVAFIDPATRSLASLQDFMAAARRLSQA